MNKRLAKAIIDNPDYKVKCFESDFRAGEIDNAGAIHSISIKNESQTIIVYFWR